MTADSRLDGLPPRELLRRYDRPGPRYTSYPTAPAFAATYSEADHRKRLAEADASADEPLSLYLHLPFCEERCTYCGCHVVVTRRRDVATRYLGALHREIDLLAAALPHRRGVSQLHWGGGTPTYHDADELAALFGRLTAVFRLQPGAEVAIEVDPRVTSPEQLRRLRKLGFNRVSMGVQDFAPEVQEAIGRGQSRDETEQLFAQCRVLGFDSVNLDLVYGLPRQTSEGFARGVRSVVALQPDRVALYSYAHVPWIKPHQKRIDAAALPAPETKLALFHTARELFLGAGYVQIGMDHFVRPGDELARAAEDRRLSRNFMGYTVRMGSDMLGLGISAIGDVRASFAQNAKKLSAYHAAIEAGRLPVERGYRLSEDDLVRREVITRLMCGFRVEFGDVERRFGIRFPEYFAGELAELNAPGGPVEDGLARITNRRIEVVGHGRMFVRNLCMVFDRYLRDRAPDKPLFSRTV